MTEPLLDPSRLARLHRLGGAELVASLIDSFAGEAPARRAALERAQATEDLTSLAQAAHTLVGGAGQLGAAALAAEARAVEEAVRSGDRATALGRTPALLAAFANALTALDKARTLP